MSSKYVKSAKSVKRLEDWKKIKGSEQFTIYKRFERFTNLKDLKDVTPEEMLNVVFAYEPVWAIGTGLVCPATVAQEVHQFIRSLVVKKYGAEIGKKTIIQYGGSVKPDNVKEIMSMPDIDGCLVGGASLNAESFNKIVRFNQ